MGRALASSALALLLLAMWTQPARALELEEVAGAYRLEGTDSQRRDFTAFLSLQRVGRSWRMERSGQFLGKEREERPWIWVSQSLRVSGSSLRVTFVQGHEGIADAIDPDTKRYVFDVTYRFYAGGVSETVIPRDEDSEWRYSRARGKDAAPELELVRERSFKELLGDALDRYEASGLTRVGEQLYAVFDNDKHVAQIDLDLTTARLHETKGSGKSNFEGLAHDPVTGRFYALVESKRHKGKDEDFGRVWELDADFQRLDRAWLKVELPSDNRGFEGAVVVRRGGERYLLALLEGNKGKAGSKGERRGEGRLEVFRADGDDLDHVTTVKIPESAFFVDYSGIDVRGDQVVIVSQTSSALWVGELSGSSWELRGGKAYRFPREHSRLRYPAIEGVTWVSAKRVAVVSDAHESGTTESIHLFDLP